MFLATRKATYRRPGLVFHCACSDTTLCEPLFSLMCVVLKGMSRSTNRPNPTTYLPSYGLIDSIRSSHPVSRGTVSTPGICVSLRSWFLQPTLQFLETHLPTRRANSGQVHRVWIENRQSAPAYGIKKPASSEMTGFHQFAGLHFVGLFSHLPWSTASCIHTAGHESFLLKFGNLTKS